MKAFILVLMLIFSGNVNGLDYKIYTADGPSMAPTILAQDRLTVDPNYYDDHPIEHGDIVIFQVTDKKNYVKRVVGLPGETVKMSGNRLYVNNTALEETYLADAIHKAEQEGEIYNQDFPEFKIPEDSVFVLGDNPNDSMDSRVMGPIGIDKIVGKVIEIRPSK